MFKKRKVLCRYEWASKCNKPQCFTFKIATCGTFKKIVFIKKNSKTMHRREKNPVNKNDFLSPFTSLYQI